MIHLLSSCSAAQQLKERAVTMPLDIVTQTNKDVYEHHRLDDCSLFTERGKVRRVPIDALLSKPDLTPSGEVIQEIVTPKRMNISSV